MKKITKVLMVALCALCLVSMTSCKAIKKAKVAVVEKTLSTVASKAGIENFELPECEDVKFKMQNDTKNGNLGVELDIVNPECTLDEYKDQLMGYVEEAIIENAGLTEEELEEVMGVVKPELIDGGYRWSLESLDPEEFEDSPVDFEIILINNNGTFELRIQASGLTEILGELEGANGGAEEGNPVIPQE